MEASGLCGNQSGCPLPTWGAEEVKLTLRLEIGKHF